MKDKRLITIIIVILIIFIATGIKGVLSFLDVVKLVFITLVSAINSLTIALIGDSILTLLFKSTITYFLVGLILSFYNKKRGRFAKYSGKASYYFIGYFITIMLNFIASLFY